MIGAATPSELHPQHETADRRIEGREFVTQPTIYHNPRCSKSRATLQLLRERGFEPRVIEYLVEPPTAEELDEIMKMLDIEPRQMLRVKEEAYARAGLADETLGRDALLRLMAANPSVLERPVVVYRGRAAIGRPPEQVLAIL